MAMSNVVTTPHLLESLKREGLVLLPIKRYRELTHYPDTPFPEIRALWSRLVSIPAVETVMARRAGNRCAIWTVADRLDDQIRETIYWQEWELMGQYPDLDFDFRLLERQGRPLETLVTVTDMDVFMRREAASRAL
jgi:hypothetical protein